MVRSNRGKMKDMEAIYFIEPCEGSISQLIRDFKDPKNTYYKCAHVFFTSHVTNRYLEMISKVPSLVSSIKTLNEAHIDYLAVEQRFFSVSVKDSFFRMYSPDSNLLQEECNRIVNRLYGICATFDFPLIRYSRTHPLSAAIAANLCGLIESKKDGICRNSKAILLIVDRTHDLISPLIHEFTYQAMLCDIKGVNEKNLISLEKDGEIKESDDIWRKTRHWHIEQVLQKIISAAKQMNIQFKEDREASQTLKNKGDIQGLFYIAKNAPKQEAIAERLTEHLDRVQQCIYHFKQSNLEALASIEQDLSTGKTANDKSVEYRKIYKAMKQALNDLSIPSVDKLRTMLIHSNTGPTKDNWADILDSLSNSDREILVNYKALLNSSANLNQVCPMPNQGQIYTLSRYRPYLSKIIKGLYNDDLPVADYPFFDINQASRMSDKVVKEKSRWIPSSPKSKSRWNLFTKKQSKPVKDDSKRKIILFVIGGVSANEVRECYKMSDDSTEVFIGSSHIWTPIDFIQELKRIRPSL